MESYEEGAGLGELVLEDVEVRFYALEACVIDLGGLVVH